MVSLALMAVLFSQDLAPVVLPFAMENGHVYLQGKVAGQSVSVLLDSGAGATVMDLDLAKRLRLQSAGPVRARGSGAQEKEGMLLRGIRLDLLGSGSQQNVLAAIDLAPLAVMEGRELQVVLGRDFFATRAIQIDYPARKVRIWPGDEFRPPSGVPRLSYRLVNNLPHVSAFLQPEPGKRIEVVAMIDTGATSALTATAKLSKAQGLAEKLKGAPLLPQGAGVGGMTMGRKGRFEAFEIAGTKLARPIVDVTDTEQGALGLTATYDVLVGSGTLERFVVTFDGVNRHIYFKPSSLVGQPFESDMLGVRWVAQKGDLRKYEVASVVAGTPADEAGLKQGDELVSVDGKAASDWTLGHIKQMFREHGKDRTLVVRRAGQVLTKRIVLRRQV